MSPRFQVSRGVNGKTREQVEAGVYNKVHAIDVDQGRIRRKAGHDGIDGKALHVVSSIVSLELVLVVYSEQ
jgi:Na+-transporting NADH:ubiquinone oxidoreductase subunit NqrA